MDLELPLKVRNSNDIVGMHAPAYISSCRNGDRAFPADYKGRIGCALNDVEEAICLIYFCPYTDFIAEKEARTEVAAIGYWVWTMNRSVKEAY